MQETVVTMAGLMGVALVFMMIVQGMTRRVDILSLRNLYLASFIIYQISSPCLALYYSEFTLFKVFSPEMVAKKYLLYLYLFVPLFLISYHWVKITPWIAKKLSGPPVEVSDSYFLALAVGLVCLAIPLRFLGPMIPGIAAPATQISIAMAATASAIAGWVWGNRRFNLGVIAMMIFIVMASLAIGMAGAFGRRPLLSILLGLLWGAYHRRIRHMKLANLAVMLAPLVILVVVAVSAFTAIRNNRTTAEARIQDTAHEMAQADVKYGAANILGGQTCGSAMLWCMENYPHVVQPRTLHTLKVIVCWYIPKAYWPDKPVPLGNYIASLAKLDQVNRHKLTIPPGVLGYAAAEGGLLAVFLYAVYYGQFLRFFDEMVRLNPNNPLIILPVGCATGQVLGLARGCIAIFSNLVVLGFISTFLMLWVAGKLFGSRSVRTYYAPSPQWR